MTPHPELDAIDDYSRQLMKYLLKGHETVIATEYAFMRKQWAKIWRGVYTDEVP